MGGRPEGFASEAGAFVLDCASTITPSARWSDCFRMSVLDWRVEFSELREAISPRSWATAEWRDCDCEWRELVACSDWVVCVWRVSARALETALWRASFSGFGGIGGGGPADVKEGRSI